MEDKYQAQKSLDWVRRHVGNKNCLVILANHDVGINTHTIEL